MNWKHTALLLLFAPLAGAFAAEPSADPLSWMAGCWRAENAEAGSGEQWMAPAGGALLGMSRTVRGGKLVAYEFMRIVASADGKLVFFAQPSGKPPASFALRSLAADEVVFENPEHEFPQRIVYKLAAPGRLQARIEGLRNGVARGIDFPMARVACDAP